MTKQPAISGYRYDGAGLGHSHDYLLPTLFRVLDGVKRETGAQRLFELGCGNGSVARVLSECGWDVTGVDPSVEGVAQANRAYPDLKLSSGSAYDDLAARYGQFPVVISLEVVEHVYAPRQYAATLFTLVEGGEPPSSRRPTTAIGRTSRWRFRASWTDISRPCGTTDTSSSGRSEPWVNCCGRPGSWMCASSGRDGFRRWRSR